MRAGLICLLVLSGLVACSKGESGGSGPAASNDKTCGPSQAGKMSFAPTADDQDPFARFGKVLIEAGADRLSLQSERALPEKTELSVTIDLDCGKSKPTLFVDEILAQSHQSLATTPHRGLRAYTWRLADRTTLSELRERAEADACIVGIADSGRAYASASEINDPLFASQGHLKMLEASSVLDRMSALNVGRPVNIAVIDTGIDMDHEDLKNVLWKNQKEVAGNGVDDDLNGYVDDVNGYNFALNVASPAYNTDTSGYQHGTHVAGLAAAQAGNAAGGSGVMGSGARIMMLAVFGAGSGAYTSDIINAIRYAADNGADVINLSLGGLGRSAAYESALAYAIKKGAVVVAAAGNDHQEVGSNYWMSPGAYAKDLDGMLSIGSVDSSNGALSVFSNYSADYVELAAPGAEDARSRVGLLSTWPGGKYSRIQGTSMASPVAAGAAGVAIAMMRSRGYAPSPATIEEILETSANADSRLRKQIRGGRVLNLRLLKEFIETTYSFNSGAASDPGVPNFNPCGQ